MTEEENYTDVDLSDMIDDSEHYVESEPPNAETLDLAENPYSTHDSEPVNSEEPLLTEKKTTNSVNKSEVIRTTRLPMARIKNIMKMDPDVSVISGDAVFLVTKATELFLETIAKETYAYTIANKRKTISKKDLDLIVNKVDCLCFLEGAMDF
ncbi:DNA polymerase epsilon subunit 4 [Ostrinia furnacalis]|uniref:DNA polymerase epsilon subunit 4 n=1 Tax=Ostrinia furnacalis TaxID=93504 RepID=UPI00103F483F|nr:DNA polymerase epsilon subunit 4 [Ostrinia furnacalis]